MLGATGNDNITSQRQRPVDAVDVVRRRYAFTLIEILVVIGIMALLFGILGVMYSRVLGGARRAATSNQMRSMSSAIEQFKNDFGYYPPVLSDDPTAMAGPERLKIVNDDRGPMGVRNRQEARDELEAARYSSVFTMSVYLTGVGDITGANVGASGEDTDTETTRDDGVIGPGFRDPGGDHAWGGAFDQNLHAAPVTGRTYGPYLDLGSGKHTRLILDPNKGKDPVEAAGLYLFVDRWSTPIRYYRSWPTRDEMDATKPSVERIPIELFTGDAVETGTFIDPQASQTLLQAPYALVSAGSDRLFFDNQKTLPPDLTRWGLPLGGPFTDMTTAGFSNSVELDMLKMADPGGAALGAFVRSLRDNVVVTP